MRTVLATAALASLVSITVPPLAAVAWRWFTECPGEKRVRKGDGPQFYGEADMQSRADRLLARILRLVRRQPIRVMGTRRHGVELTQVRGRLHS